MAKKELVILAGECFPVSSATGAIAVNFGKYLSGGYHVRMIVTEQEGFHYDANRIGAFEVYSIRNWRLKWAQRAKQKRDVSKGIRAKLYHISFQLARCIGRLQATFLTLNNNAWYIGKAGRLLEELHKQKKIDAILTCAAPHETHYAALQFKRAHPEVKWVAYWGDLLASKPNKLNIFVSIRRLQAIEQSVCNAADYVLATEENASVLRSEMKNRNRLRAIPYTLNQMVLDSYHDPVIKETDIITFVYMGAFYRTIRNPEYFLELFSRLGFDYRLLLFAAGDCEDIVEKYARKSGGKIIPMQQLPKAELIQQMRRADILINIENKMAHSNPSKLLELISYGKPIIDFAHSAEICALLADYPLALSVDMTASPQQNLEVLTDFIKTHNGKTAELDFILEQYADHLESNVKQIVTDAFAG